LAIKVVKTDCGSGLLMAIVNTIKEGRSSRTIDRMGQQLSLGDRLLERRGRRAG